jgi:putative endonuclease
MPPSAQQLGMDAEDLAARFLVSKGYRILQRRYRTRSGEVDLIAVSGDSTLVFVEVKARRSTEFGTPAEAVHPAKQARLGRVAAEYLASHPAGDSPCRFDVIAILWSGGPEPVLDHLEDAFRLSF